MEKIQTKLCYECGTYHPECDMQEKDCANCGGRKCRKLHGGHQIHTCSFCGKSPLCVDCALQARCCHDFIDNEFILKQI